MYFCFSSPPAGLALLFVIGMMLILGCCLWFVVATILGVLEHLLAIRLRHTTRDDADSPRCPVCSYDLRASRFRCPECGSAINFPPPPAPRVQVYRGFVIVSSRREFDE